MEGVGGAHEKRLKKLREDTDLPPLVKTQQIEEVLAWALTEISQQVAMLPGEVQKAIAQQGAGGVEMVETLRGQGKLWSEIHAEMTEIGKGVQRLGQEQEEVARQIAARTASPPDKWKRALAVGSGGVAGVLLITGLSWVMPWQRKETVLLGRLHGVVAQHYKVLPKPIQDQIRQAYQSAGYQPPQGGTP